MNRTREKRVFRHDVNFEYIPGAASWIALLILSPTVILHLELRKLRIYWKLLERFSPDWTTHKFRHAPLHDVETLGIFVDKCVDKCCPSILFTRISDVRWKAVPYFFSKIRWKFGWQMVHKNPRGLIPVLISTSKLIMFDLLWNVDTPKFIFQKK